MTFKEWFTNRGDAELGAKIKAATSFQMGPRDRETVRAQLLAYVRMRPAKIRVVHARSWTGFLFHPLPVASLSIAIVMSGTAGAAELALPGDFLYPIKVHINEEVRMALAPTPTAKASVAIARAETRLEELTVLESRGTLDEHTREDAEERLDVQVRTAEERTLDIDDDNGEREAREERLVAVLRAHETRLAREQADIGGSLVPEVSLEAVISAEAGTPPATATLSMATDRATDPESVTDSVRTRSTFETKVDEKQPRAEETEKDTAGFDVRTTARQKRAAEQRLNALERLVERMKERVHKDALAEVRTALEQAESELAIGEEAFKDENLGQASFHFNLALRVAIDARELLSKPSWRENDKQTSDEESRESPQKGETSKKNKPPKKSQSATSSLEQDDHNEDKPNERNESTNEEKENHEKPSDSKRSGILEGLIRFGH